MIGSIVPRPIAFVSTISKNKKNNIAPFSYFNGVCSNPPTIMFAPARRGWDGSEKDTLINIRDTKEFVVNIVSESITEQMVTFNLTGPLWTVIKSRVFNNIDFWKNKFPLVCLDNFLDVCTVFSVLIVNFIDDLVFDISVLPI